MTISTLLSPTGEALRNHIGADATALGGHAADVVSLGH